MRCNLQLLQLVVRVLFSRSSFTDGQTRVQPSAEEMAPQYGRALVSASQCAICQDFAKLLRMASLRPQRLCLQEKKLEAERLTEEAARLPGRPTAGTQEANRNAQELFEALQVLGLLQA